MDKLFKSAEEKYVKEIRLYASDDRVSDHDVYVLYYDAALEVPVKTAKEFYNLITSGLVRFVRDVDGMNTVSFPQIYTYTLDAQHPTTGEPCSICYAMASNDDTNRYFADEESIEILELMN